MLCLETYCKLAYGEIVDIVLWIGRILYSGLLILMGLNHFMQLENLTQYAAAKNVPAPQIAVLGSGVLLIVGAALLFVPSLAFIGGILTAIFLVATGVMIHNFWAVEDANMKTVDMTQFFKNLALAGAALALGVLLAA